MKKIIQLLLVSLIVMSCGSSKTVRESKKVIKGNWVLNHISYNEYGTFRITFFNDVTKDCLEGSNWSFVPNNDTGIYTINNDNCKKGERNFIFVIQEVNPETGLYDFLLKPTNEKKKSVTNVGFRLKLVELSETTMQWEQKASLDGKTIIMKMNFTKQ